MDKFLNVTSTNKRKLKAGKNSIEDTISGQKILIS
jgi:hypothetical protein